MFKKFSLTVTCFFVFAACHGKTAVKPGATTKTELTWNVYGDLPTAYPLVAKSADFIAKFPNVHITFNTVPNTDPAVRLPTCLANGNCADIETLDMSYAGQIFPISPFVDLSDAKFGISLDDYPSFAADIVKASSGAIYGLPIDLAPMVMFYRIDLMRHALAQLQTPAVADSAITDQQVTDFMATMTWDDFADTVGPALLVTQNNHPPTTIDDLNQGYRIFAMATSDLVKNAFMGGPTSNWLNGGTTLNPALIPYINKNVDIIRRLLKGSSSGQAPDPTNPPTEIAAHAASPLAYPHLGYDQHDAGITLADNITNDPFCNPIAAGCTPSDCTTAGTVCDRTRTCEVPPVVSCTSRSDCTLESGLVCNAGTCGNCATDSDCGANEVCDPNGKFCEEWGPLGVWDLNPLAALDGNFYSCYMNRGEVAMEVQGAWFYAGLTQWLSGLAPAKDIAAQVSSNPSDTSTLDLYRVGYHTVGGTLPSVAWASGLWRVASLPGVKAETPPAGTTQPASAFLSADEPHLYSINGGSFVGVTQASKDPATAVAVIKYFTQTVSAQVSNFTSLRAFPAFNQAWTDPAITTPDPFFGNTQAWAAASDTAQNINKPGTRQIRSGQCDAQIWTAYRQAVDGIVRIEYVDPATNVVVGQDLSDANLANLQQQVLARLNDSIATLLSDPKTTCALGR